jgi:hypothetical protein
MSIVQILNNFEARNRCTRFGASPKFPSMSIQRENTTLDGVVSETLGTGFALTRLVFRGDLAVFCPHEKCKWGNYTWSTQRRFQ